MEGGLELGGLGWKTENTYNCFDPHDNFIQMRYYKQKYPEVDELVMVQVRQIAEMGAYVKLVRRLQRRLDDLLIGSLHTARIR